MSKYYDSEPAGADYATTTPWLNRPATLTEYGARGVPNIYITRCYMSTGDWNASHYKNPEFDPAREDVPRGGGGRARSAGRRSRWRGILLRDTPVITDYFIKYVTASSSKVKNYVPEGISHIRLAKVGLGLARHVDGRAAGERRPRRPLSTGAVTRFLLKRLGLALITLFLLSVIVFGISTILPGNVGRAVLGPFATQESVDALNEQLGNESSGLRPVRRLGGRAAPGRPRDVARRSRSRPRISSCRRSRTRSSSRSSRSSSACRSRSSAASSRVSATAGSPTRRSRSPASRWPRCRSSSRGSC